MQRFSFPIVIIDEDFRSENTSGLGIRALADAIQKEGFEVSWLGVDADGLIDPDDFAGALRPDTALAAVIWANNEVGTVEPVRELAELCVQRGIPFHSDAVQAAGRVPIDVCAPSDPPNDGLIAICSPTYAALIRSSPSPPCAAGISRRRRSRSAAFLSSSRVSGQS